MALHTTCADADSGRRGTEASALCSEHLPQPLPVPVPSSSQAQPDGSFLCHVVAVEWLIEKCSETQGLVQRGHQRLPAIRVENYEKRGGFQAWPFGVPQVSYLCECSLFTIVRLAKKGSVNLGMLAVPSQLADKTFSRLLISYP